MRTHGTLCAKLEQLEERLLLSGNPLAVGLFDSASSVNLQPVDSVVIAGHISAGQAEVYQFTAPAQGNFHVDMEALSGDLDTVLQLYTQTGRKSRGNDNANRDTLDSSVKLRVQPGQTYYVMASGKSGTSGQFSLTLTSDPTDDHGNSSDDAKEIQMRRGRGTGRGIVNYTGDDDMFELTADYDGSLAILLSRSNNRQNFSPQLAVFNAQGEQIDVNVSSNENSAQLTFLASAGETYFVRVSGEWGSKYKINAKQPTDDIGDTLNESKSIRMSRRGSATAKGAINWIADESISLTGDVDMFNLVATTTGTMTVAMNAAGRNASIDSEVYIYDSAGELIAQDDNSGINYNALVTFDVVAGETYYIKAASANDASMGKYALSISSEEQAQPDPEPEPEPDPEPDPEPEPEPESGVIPGESILAEVISVAQGLRLRIVGTDLGDVITLSQLIDSITLTTALGSQSFVGAFASVVIYGFGGADVIRLDNTVTAAGTINAGDGNDQVFDAGSGATTISGGAGDDLLVSVGGGSDTLYGNEGLDSFWVDSTDNVVDASSAETAAKTVHSITEFYQPYSTNPASDDYVSLDIAGQNFTDPTLTGYAAGYANFTDSPLFLDGPQFNDIDQGSVGDCYFLASLAALADQDPEIISQMITPLGDGTFAIRFYDNGQEVYLRLDGDLPVNGGGSLVYARMGPDGEIWVPLLEKAYAHFRYGQNSYGSLDGGWMSYTFKHLTGQYTNTRFTGGSDTDMYNYLRDQLAAGHGVTLGSLGVTPSPLVISSHAYTVMDVYTEGGQKYVVIYNTWGIDGVNSPGDRYDGLVTITISEVQENFSAAVTTLT